MIKNKFAVALGKMAKGKKKTGLSETEIQRRRELAISNSKKIAFNRKNR